MGGMDVKIGGEVEKVNAKELTYGEFVKRFMQENIPVVIKGLMDDWKACTDWVTINNGQPNFHFLISHFGSSKVQVADCGTREFTDQKREEMQVSDFIRCWLEGSPVQSNVDNHNTNDHGSVLYLKDWHFVKEYPEYLAYNTPVFFHDDWLNLYLDFYKMHTDPDSYQQNSEICCSDYRFVYMGAKGSWTPLHADVFRSYSWSANVCGKKKWLFLAPHQSHLVFDRNLKSCVYDIFAEVSESTFPGFKKTTWLECMQEAGEIIFVPSGWYHQVHNLEDTISINHNWFNAYNLSWVWNLLLRDYNEAKEYIEDIKDICDDFEGLCQRNLFANTGMNFYDFFTFITCFTLANIALLYHLSGKYGSPPESSLTITQHLVFNIGSVRKVALEMKTMHALEGNHDCYLDIIKTSEDPRFYKLCAHLRKTYVKIHEQPCLSSEFENSVFDYLMGLDVLKACSSSRIHTPEDLIRLIDNAVSELGDNYTQQLSTIHVS